MVDNSNKEITMSLDKFMGDVLDEEDIKHQFLIRRYLRDAIIKKRRDHYYSVIGKMTDDKGHLCRVEIKFTPKKAEKYRILIRNKSIIKGEFVEFNGPNGPYRKKVKFSVETMSKDDLDLFKNLMDQVDFDENKCMEFANFEISRKTMNRFNI